MMQDTLPHEDAALEHAGKCAGEYLDELGKTDLSELTSEEWVQIIRVVGLNFLHKRAELQPCPF